MISFDKKKNVKKLSFAPLVFFRPSKRKHNPSFDIFYFVHSTAEIEQKLTQYDAPRSGLSRSIPFFIP
jgi:hypothetical protein